MSKVPAKQDLRKILTPQQYSCTQEDGTEPAFNNKYWDNKADGIYIDIVSGEPLFSSLEKYDSGSGWPSFHRPLQKDRLITKEDRSLGRVRTEVRSKKANSHLGHVFPDGPGPEKTRYCINSASLDFVPLEQLKQKGLGRYLFDFAEKKGWQIATVAGGCFWGLEKLLASQAGVIETRVGYSGGTLSFATYETVKQGKTGHAETVQVLFDPAVTNYRKILLYFFKIHDPTTLNKQGNDIGTQYRSVIFYANAKQREEAEIVKKQVEASGKWKQGIVTEILPLGDFWLAEDYHQKYLDKNAGGYTCHYERPFEFELTSPAK